jgi:hypothetical protein
MVKILSINRNNNNMDDEDDDFSEVVVPFTTRLPFPTTINELTIEMSINPTGPLAF